MPENIHLSDVWEHTIVKIFKHDPKSELGLMINEWVIFNKLENFNSLLNYTSDAFTPSGNLCYFKDNDEILHQTPLQELFNLRCNRKCTKTLSKAPCLVALRMYLTLHLLLVAQSM